MIVLDTSALIHLASGTKAGQRFATQLGDEPLATTAINLNEALVGLTDNQRAVFKPIIDRLEVLPLDAEAAIRSAELEQKMYSIGKPLGKMDALTAAVCLVNDLPLATGDKSFKRVDGLEVLYVEM